MKVLEKGRAQIYICTGKYLGGGGCGAKLLVGDKDIKGYYGSEGDRRIYQCFFCPLCETRTAISFE